MSVHRPQFGLVLANRGVVLGTTSVQALLTLARQAEETGWDSVWVGDSLLAKPRLDAIVLLSALAVQTHRVKLGPASFTSTPLRHALQLALQWCSLDVLSQGRMIFNASQGAPGPAGGAFVEEYAAFQIEPASRMRRMEEAIEILRLASSGENISYEGTYYHVHQAAILPRPIQQPLPIWISTNTDERKPKMAERALRRVARYADGWMTIHRTPERFAQDLAAIQRYGEEEGRVLPPEFPASLYLDIHVDEDRERAFRECKRYLDQYYQQDFPRTAVEVLAVFGSPQQCIERLRVFQQAGVTLFVLRLTGENERQQFERVTCDVLPAFT